MKAKELIEMCEDYIEVLLPPGLPPVVAGKLKSWMGHGKIMSASSEDSGHVDYKRAESEWVLDKVDHDDGDLKISTGHSKNGNSHMIKMEDADVTSYLYL